MNYRELAQMARTLTGRQVCDILEQNFEASREGKPGFLKPSDFSFRDLYEAFVGSEALRMLDPRNQVSVLEASEAVDSTTFLSIAETVVSAEALNAYERSPYLISSLFPVVPTRLESEMIAGIYPIVDGIRNVHEGMPYPHVGLAPTNIETPKTTKRGVIIALTKEAIFFDRTGQVLEQARNVGDSMRLDEENQAIDLLIGATNNFVWEGTAYDTYQSSTPWINDINAAAAALVDWTDIDQAEALFGDMTDPQGQPITIPVTHLIAPSALKSTARRVLSGMEVHTSTDSGNIVTTQTNPVDNYTAIFSRHLTARLVSEGIAADAAKARATWFLGNPARFGMIRENWPLTVVQAPPNSEAEFSQDIVARFKVSAKRVAAIREPRAMVRVRGYAP